MATFKLKEVSGIEASLEAMRFPMGSEGDSRISDTVEQDGEFVIGDGDHELAKKLANVKSGTGHDTFLKGITAHLEVEAPHYWWNQAQRYHWFDIISSSSKMHLLVRSDIGENCTKWVCESTLNLINGLIKVFNSTDYASWGEEELGYVLSEYGIFITPSSGEELYECILDNLPMGYKLKAGIVTNYLQLKTMYWQRKNHKLTHWNKDFVAFINELPLSELITKE